MNAAVGEKEVELGGRTYVLRPGFEAFAEMESLLPGAGVSKLYRRATEIAVDPYAGLGLRETAAILYACAKFGGTKNVPSYVEFGKLVMQSGYRNHVLLCYEILSVAFPPDDRETAPEDQEKKTTKTATPTPNSGDSTTSSISQETGSA